MKLKRRQLLTLGSAAVTCGAWPMLAQGDGERAVPLVGILVSTGLHPLDYMRQGLRELGFVEGQNVAFAFRSADGDPRDLPGLARQLAQAHAAANYAAAAPLSYAAQWLPLARAYAAPAMVVATPPASAEEPVRANVAAE